MNKQKRNIKTTGSFFNWMMGNNSTGPKVGEGATELMWSDRHAYEVTWVSDDGSECKIQRYRPERTDSLGMSDCQSYKYEKLSDHKIHIIWRKKQGGCWCVKGKEVRFTKKYAKECGYDFIAKSLTQEQRDEIYQDDHLPIKVVDGITKEYTTYRKINLIFGQKEEYYDFSF